MYDEAETSTQQPLEPASDTAEFETHIGPASILEEIEGAEFPLARRGYDREAVDAYVARMTQLVEDLEATRSPRGAIDRALEEVGVKTTGILRQAQETAEEMTQRSEAEAAERVERAERAAQEREAQAEANVRRLDEDTDRLWVERRRLIQDTRRLAESLLALADDADERFPGAPQADDDISVHRGELREALAEGLLVSPAGSAEQR